VSDADDAPHLHHFRVLAGIVALAPERLALPSRTKISRCRGRSFCTDLPVSQGCTCVIKFERLKPFVILVAVDRTLAINFRYFIRWTDTVNGRNVRKREQTPTVVSQSRATRINAPALRHHVLAGQCCRCERNYLAQKITFHHYDRPTFLY
jgi:hypothetical protein